MTSARVYYPVFSTPWIAIGIAAVVVSFSACWSIDHCHDGRGRSIVRVGSLMTGIGLCFWLALASHLTSMRLLLPGQPSASADSLGDYLWLGHGFYLFGALMIGILALAVRRREDERRTAAATSLVSWGRRVWAAPVVITILAATYMLNLRQSDADVAAAKASQFKATRGWPLVTALYEVAVGKAPRTAFYREALGNALLQQAVGTTDPRARIAVLDNAERVLDAGARMYPLEAGFEANLGDVFLQKALLESDPRGRRTMATRAGQHLEIALRLEPSNFNSWTKAAYVDLALLDDSAAAAAKVRRSLAVHSTSDEALALAGDIDIAMTGRAREQNERRRLLEEAVGYYEKAIEHNASRYQYRAALARAHRALGRRDAAIDDYLRARERAPQTEWGEIDRAITQLRLERSE